MHTLFDDYLIYLILILLITTSTWWIIWWLFDDHSCTIILIIWWVIIGIWWLFCLNDFDFLVFFDDYSGSIILITWCLFVLIIRDYLISTPAVGRLASFISESLRTASWHILVMAACFRGHIAACELQQELFIICNLAAPTILSFLQVSTCQAFGVLLQGVKRNSVICWAFVN